MYVEMDSNAFNVEATDLLLFRKFKKSDDLCIVGNGPSSEYISTDFKSQLESSDVVGFSLALFSNLNLTYYFHEPVHLVPHAPPKFHNTYEYTQHIILYHLLREMCTVLDNSSQIAAICNPHFPKDRFGYWNMPKRRLLLPPYHFINEVDDATILQELKAYVNHFPVAKLLNFRGSMIRAISLGYLLGYNRILITGYDPSSPSCWYSNKDSRLFANDLSQDLRRDILNLSLARINSRNEFDVRSCFFTLPRAVLYAIRVLDSALLRINRPLPRISFLTTCSRTKELLDETRLSGRLESFYDLSSL